MVHKTVYRYRPCFKATQKLACFYKHEYNDSSMLLQNDFLCRVQSMSNVFDDPASTLLYPPLCPWQTKII